MLLRKFLYYLNPLNLFRKEDVNINLRLMGGINKITILMFIICLIVIAVRWITRW
ncbi:MAG: hypothetical protein IT223_10035 [Crocinitomicaceae bacterium]|nr:hypothetical protein [Crocinitomicaceae bacterium]